MDFMHPPDVGPLPVKVVLHISKDDLGDRRPALPVVIPYADYCPLIRVLEFGQDSFYLTPLLFLVPLITANIRLQFFLFCNELSNSVTIRPLGSGHISDGLGPDAAHLSDQTHQTLDLVVYIPLFLAVFIQPLLHRGDIISFLLHGQKPNHLVLPWPISRPAS